MLNIYTKFHENMFNSFNVIEGTRFPYKREYNCHFKIPKGHNYMRSSDVDTDLALFPPSDDGLYFDQNL